MDFVLDKDLTADVMRSKMRVFRVEVQRLQRRIFINLRRPERARNEESTGPQGI
jgi:hypothetical protein